MTATDVEFAVEERLDILTRARALLTEHGWTRLRYYDAPTDCFCTVGAIEEATIPGLYTKPEGGNEDDGPFGPAFVNHWRLSADVLHDLQVTLDEADAWRSYYKGVLFYNDHTAKSVDDVLALFDHTIARLQSVVGGE